MCFKVDGVQNGYLPSCCFAHKKNEIRKEYDHRMILLKSVMSLHKQSNLLKREEEILK